MPVTRGEGIRSAAVLAALILSGCQAGYVLRQGAGQLRLRREQVPLDDPRLAEKVPAEDLEKLRWVPAILDFCRNELGLDPGDSYRTYADTGGSPVSHAVTACHPLALIPYQWHFPFVGTVPYKGYFDRDDARREAARLEGLGYESRILPVTAFSTLGWFQDPVLSTMLEGNIADLADVIIHETTHRTLYFGGATSFNESLATHMAREGTVRFLEAHDDLRDLIPGYLAERDAAEEREKLLLRLRNDLESLYRSPAPAGVKEARKKEIFETASAAYRRLRGMPGAALPASNAFVLSVARYHEFTPLLSRLEESLGGEPGGLMAYLKALPPGGSPVAAIEEAIPGPRPSGGSGLSP